LRGGQSAQQFCNFGFPVDVHQDRSLFGGEI
jgi:hypothetical protein